MIRGVKGIHHIALSVPDLEAAERFYAGVLGFEVAERYDFEASPEGDVILGLENGAARSVMLNAGNLYLEVFEFATPEPKPQRDRPVCDHGYTHIALEVDDIEGVYTVLAEAGVRWHCPPSIASDPDGGVINTYGRDPFGNVIELQQVTAGLEWHVDRLPRWKS
jgi:catechol 2,3-dioxygenase-like lactoylglutathione lyase family enzyme